MRIRAETSSSNPGAEMRSAAEERRERSPDSLPKDRCVMPKETSMPTPARAKRCADAMHQGKGSSNTASAPPSQAARARTALG